MSLNTFFEQNYETLVKFNLKKNELNDVDVINEINNYFDRLQNWDIYPWNTEIIKKKEKYVYPNMHPHFKKIVDIFRELDINNIIEIGSGNGKIIKILYQILNNELNKNCSFTCLEGKQLHIDEMMRNFNKDNENITSPRINVKANFVKGFSQNMSFDDNTFDMVFTCTVMMHQPFIPAILTLCECARITKKYVFHIENKNYDPNNKNYKYNAICMPKNNNLSEYNKLPLDYKSIYEYMGFKTIQFYDFYDPNVPDALYTIYLGEKLNSK